MTWLTQVRYPRFIRKSLYQQNQIQTHVNPKSIYNLRFIWSFWQSVQFLLLFSPLIVFCKQKCRQYHRLSTHLLNYCASLLNYENSIWRTRVARGKTDTCLEKWLRLAILEKWSTYWNCGWMKIGLLTCMLLTFWIHVLNQICWG